MDAPRSAGYQLDPSQWDKHVKEAISFFSNLIVQESFECSEINRTGEAVQGAVQVPWREINGLMHIITIRPQHLVDFYCHTDLEERVAHLENWRQVAYFYMLEQFSQRLFKIASIAETLKVVVPAYQDAESLQSSRLLRSIVVQYAQRELLPPSQGEQSPEFRALGDKYIVKVLCLLSKIFCEEAKELNQLKEFPPDHPPKVFRGFLSKERWIKVADYPLRPLHILKQHSLPDIALKIERLNPFKSILFSYIAKKSSQIIAQDTFLSFFCGQYGQDLGNNPFLQSSVYKVLSEEAEAFLAIPAKIFTLATLPKFEPNERIQQNVDNLNGRFSKTKHIAQATLYAPESLFQLNPEALINEAKERLKKDVTVTLIADDAWEYFLDKVRYRKAVKSFVPAKVAAAPKIEPPSLAHTASPTSHKSGCWIM